MHMYMVQIGMSWFYKNTRFFIDEAYLGVSHEHVFSWNSDIA